MKNAFFLIVGLAFIAGCFYLFLSNPAPAKYHGLMSIQLGGETFQVKVASTDEERAQGLSGVASLAPNTGMFFVFETPGQHGIWMKDMHFSIDIAWLDADYRIIWLEKDVSPDTFPQVFYPPVDVMAVLEVPAGTFEKLGVDIGDGVFPR